MAEDFVASELGFAFLEPLCPNEGENRVVAQEQSMRTVIDVLPTEVPEVQPHRFREAFQCHSHFAELDPMSGRDVWVKWQIVQPAAKLRLADSPVAEKQDLDLRVDLLAGLKVLVVGADFMQDVLKAFLAADFRGQIIELAPR
jgi:hypothetical protein